MATTTARPDLPSAVNPSSFEEAAARIRELDETLIDSSKAAGNTTLDAYERALTMLIDVEEQVADAWPLEWMSALARTHAALVREITSVSLKTARELFT